MLDVYTTDVARHLSIRVTNNLPRRAHNVLQRRINVDATSCGNMTFIRRHNVDATS